MLAEPSNYGLADPCRYTARFLTKITSSFVLKEGSSISVYDAHANMPESDVESDVREGGSFTIIMHAGSDDLPHTGKYLEIIRPKKLVFTWISHRSVDNSIVTLNFTKITSNKTSILLTHVKFLDEESRSDHEGGWTSILGKLNDLIG